MRDYAEQVKELREGAEWAKKLCAHETAKRQSDAAGAIDELLDELTTIRKQLPRWISVEDELPESGERVLIMFEPFEDDENISIGWLTKSGFDCYDDSVYFFRSVTHWMPLPAPPKGVE